MKINLVLQSYGSTCEYYRAIFSILSFYAYCSRPKDQTFVIIFTDNKEFFKPYLNDLPITYMELSQAKITDMRGGIDFVHRVKICVIEEALEIIQGNIIYVDSDTFFISDPVYYFNQLNEDRSFMHINEYPFKTMSTFKLPAGQTFRTFYDFVVGRTFSLSDEATIKISQDQISWNAGVILLHFSHKKLLSDVYSLTDAFYPQTKNHGCEQYAFSIILDHRTKLASCEDMVYHYWLPVKKPIADKFFSSRLSASWATGSSDIKTIDVRRWTKELPQVFEKDVLMLQYNAIQAFNEGFYLRGYGYSVRALLKDPFDSTFIKDMVYHTGRLLGTK